jgi:hypothetical protein
MLRLRSAQAKARGDRQAERGPALSEVEVSNPISIKIWIFFIINSYIQENG